MNKRTMGMFQCHFPNLRKEENGGASSYNGYAKTEGSHTWAEKSPQGRPAETHEKSPVLLQVRDAAQETKTHTTLPH